MQFHSEEWLNVCKEKMNSGDHNYMKKAGKLKIRFCNVITDCPEGTDRKEVWIIEKGKCLSVTFEEKPAPSDFRTEPFDKKVLDYRNTSDYHVLSELFRGEITNMQAFMDPRYVVDGPKMRLLSIMDALDAWADIQKTVPTEI